MRSVKVFFRTAHEAHRDAAALCPDDRLRARTPVAADPLNGEQRVRRRKRKPLIPCGDDDLILLEGAQRRVDKARRPALAKLFKKRHRRIGDHVSGFFKEYEPVERDLQDDPDGAFWTLLRDRGDACGKVAIVLQNAVHRTDGARAVQFLNGRIRKGKL